MPDIGYWLGRKYSILQQEADATSRNAASTAQNANSNSQNAATAAMTGAASAALDKVRANLLPKQAAADIAQTTAQTGLIGQQAKYFGPVALAGIANTRANTALTNTTNAVSRYEGLGDISGLDPTVRAAVQKQRDNGIFSLSDIVPTTPTRTPWYSSR